jgi:hypothetical protein
MKLIKLGAKGDDVILWQYFLIGQGYQLRGGADGDFGAATQEATIHFQQDHGLQPDGVVGNRSYGIAMTLGFGGVTDTDKSRISQNWPPAPSDLVPLVGNVAKQNAFGTFAFKIDPKSDGSILVTDNWAKDNMTMVKVPQLKLVTGTGDRIYFHKKGAEQLKALWAGWEREGLLHLVKTYSGAYNPRLIRGSETNLSMHAFGTAFDINVAWNKLGAVPALVGQQGQVRELVPLANKHGFYWGGHFKTRPDGMHFEIAKLL